MALSMTEAANAILTLRQVFRGHKKEAFSVAWHPVHEDMFASGGSEGSIIFWQVG